MAVVSDSKTASQMRDEVLTELRRQHERAKKALHTRIAGKGWTQKDLAFHEGYAGALACQIDFWENVWVEGKQAKGE